ncbi:(2Fe-2S)-binding protein [Fluviispira multicolorata]|uniref:(2Fe-2S)-binding protein n=1 Tax=Fluviispira multicolorata TaxID=2654512 RepID=A0A833JBE3_9BACT|nr:(2Fe-2S)-binding protein [Fluviispira multicolorata]KAB8029164.1 (2Fe-2S)-binding protein [Fluviispira multicolorata]
MNDKKLTIEEIKARLKIVCICKGIKQSRICDAILKGADTVDKVNQATGSGSGGCNATRCGPVIKKLVESKGKIILEPYQTEVEDDDLNF